jgi:hypothetical protein
MARQTDRGIDGTRTFSWAAKHALLVVLAGALVGCGKGSGPTATAKFCNDLWRNGASFVGYLNFVGSGVNNTWYASSGDCTPCRSIAAEKTLDFEYGDDDRGTALASFTDILDEGGEYAFWAEVNPDTDVAEFNLYDGRGNYLCEEL